VNTIAALPKREQENAMKKLTAAVVMFASVGPTAVAADFTDTAPVVSATPITERVIEPRQECTTETPTVQTSERSGNPDGSRSYAGAIIGGVAGALLGHQVGKGRGNTAATAAGAIAGTVIGDRIDNRQTASASTQPVQRCRTVETTREVIKGYAVVYRYNGRDVATTLPYDPGQTVKVSVGIIDEYRQADAPAGSMMGNNARDLDPVSPARRIPVSSRRADTYTYRY
jgi:uncharacterized protein YcfJ